MADNAMTSFLVKVGFQGDDKSLKQLERDLSDSIKYAISNGTKLSKDQAAELFASINNAKKSETKMSNEELNKASKLNDFLSGNTGNAIKDMVGKITGKAGSSLTGMSPEQLAAMGPQGAAVAAALSVAKSALDMFVSEVIDPMIDAVKDALRETINLQNTLAYNSKFISQNSIAVDSTTRQTMAGFGMNSVEANAFNTTLSAMGMSVNDLMYMTEAQRDMFNEQYGIYQEMISVLDNPEYKEFGNTVQGWFLTLKNWAMEIEISFQKLIQGMQPVITLIMNAVGVVKNLIITVSNLLGSAFSAIGGILNPLVSQLQMAFNTFAGVIKGVEYIITPLLEAVGYIFSVFSYFAEPMEMFGETLGKLWISVGRLAGSLIGIFNPALKVLADLFSFLEPVLEGINWVLDLVIGSLSEFFTFLSDLVSTLTFGLVDLGGIDSSSGGTFNNSDSSRNINITYGNQNTFNGNQGEMFRQSQTRQQEDSEYLTSLLIGAIY